jgi:hypothetical protein
VGQAGRQVSKQAGRQASQQVGKSASRLMERHICQSVALWGICTASENEPSAALAYTLKGGGRQAGKQAGRVMEMQALVVTITGSGTPGA